jgi:hypothetical protein
VYAIAAFTSRAIVYAFFAFFLRFDNASYTVCINFSCVQTLWYFVIPAKAGIHDWFAAMNSKSSLE